MFFFTLRPFDHRLTLFSNSTHLLMLNRIFYLHSLTKKEKVCTSIEKKNKSGISPDFKSIHIQRFSIKMYE